MPAASFALLFAFASATGASVPAAPASPPAARSDGSWQVTEAIHEERPPLASVTDGLLADEQIWADAQQAAEAVAEAEAEAGAQRAFEEAVDVARREPRR